MASCALLAAAAIGASCAEPLDTTRRPADNGTFGQTVFTILCQRLAYQADLADGGTLDVAGRIYKGTCRNGDPLPAGAYPGVAAMAERRGEIVGALDTMFPEAYLDELQGYVTSNQFLALYDDGTMEHSLAKLGEMFDLMAADGELTAALSRMDARTGYRPLRPALGLMRAVAEYDGLSTLVKELTDAIGQGGAAHAEWLNFQRALSFELRDSSPSLDPDAPDRTLRLALDLLFSESPMLGFGVPRLLVLRDKRGVALVDDTGGLPSPFVDVDADGLADIDAMGRYVDATGLPIAAPTPFASPLVVDTAVARDADGRALQAAGGAPLYRYVDLDRTVLAALSRDVPNLFDPLRGTALDFLRGASSLLGPRVPDKLHTFESGSTLAYRGYDTTSAPLLDMLYGLLTLAADPNLPDTLAWSRKLFVEEEAAAARLLEAIFEAADLADTLPDVNLEPGSPLFDDLIPVVVKIMNEPGLVEDLLRALENPAMRDLGDRFRDQMKYKDRFDLDASAPPYALIGSFSTPVDYTKVDSGYERSVFQRLLHLIHDSSGVEMCNKQDAEIQQFGITLATYDECELLRVPDLAIFYVQSIAYARDGSGNFRTDGGNLGTHFMPKATLQFNFNNGLIEAIASDDFIEDQATINGFRRHPTPAALNRVLLLDPMPDFLAHTMDPAVDADGDRFIDQHAGCLPVWEKDGFYQQIQPLVQAFADHNREDLFVEFLVVLHDHWPTPPSLDTQSTNPNGHGFAKESGIRRFEPQMVKILEQGDLWHALVDLAPTLNNLSANGKNGRRILADAGRYMFRPQAGLADRQGATSTMTEDGRAVPVLSPWYVMADAWGLRGERVAESASEGEAWERSTGHLVDTFLRGQEVGDTWTFRNPRFRGVTVAIIDYVAARVQAHEDAGDLLEWSREDLPARAERVFTGPLFAGAADFVLSLAAAPAARAAFEDFQVYLMSEAGEPDAFVTALTGAADLVQLVLDDENTVPVARFMGKMLDPELGFLDSQIEFLRGARAADATDALAKLLGYAFADAGGQDGKTAAGALIDGICDVNRADPVGDLGAPFAPEDYVSVLAAVRDFLLEEKRGFLKFVKIVKERHVRD